MTKASAPRKGTPKNALPIIISAGIAIVIFSLTYLLNVSFLGATWIIVGGLLTISIAAIAILAGFVVVKSLFLIAAELSLLIFLAQSYCDATIGVNAVARSQASDDALRSLILLGLIYITGAFVQELYAALRDRFAKIGASAHVSGVPGWNARKVVVTTVFLVFAGLFLVEIFLVIRPIVAGLCVYR
jgi:hypothetical protein